MTAALSVAAAKAAAVDVFRRAYQMYEDRFHTVAALRPATPLSDLGVVVNAGRTHQHMPQLNRAAVAA